MNEMVIKGRVTLRNKIARSLWNIVYFFFFRPFGTKLFLPWRLLLLKSFGAKVFWDSGVYASSKIWAPWNLQLGHNTWIGPNVICYNQAKVILEDNVTISQYSYICTAGHQTDSMNTFEEGLIIAPIKICKGAWVGTRAYIGMGVEIGAFSIVGATASVYKDVDSWTIVGGNPAKMLRRRSINTNLKI